MSAQNVRRHLREVRDHFGKIGLLIDDSSGAGSRIARELYGTESLPGWWLQAWSVECGVRALRAFIDIFDERWGGRGLVLIDRFLPIRDGDRPTAWDVLKSEQTSEKTICREMEGLVRELMSRQQTGAGFEYELVTSYPHVSLDLGTQSDDGIPIPWQTRSIEVLFQRRPRLHPALQTYGPERNALVPGRRVTKVRAFQKVDEAQWKARAWRPSIERLANALAEANEAVPIVLFTGAGASLAEGSFGAGMPPTWWLLEETCRAIVHDWREGETRTGRLRERHGGPPPRAVAHCCHEQRQERKSSPTPFPIRGKKRIAPIDWLVDHLLSSSKHRAYDLQCRLETIFSRELNQESRRDARKFYQYFRVNLERFDHGFAYHHWLLAQMPWTRIITTNFDSFHERAAFAAASEFEAEPRARQERLALANAFPDVALTVDDDARFAELSMSFRLFKPYGNLLSPSELALGDEDLANFQERLQMSFRGLNGHRRGWLVVVGHAMNDDYISDTLKALDKHYDFHDKFELLWVDPEAYMRCAPANRRDGKHRSTWEAWIYSKMERRDRGNLTDHASGPLPGTALEFTYDLWTEYRRAVQARIGGG